MAADGFDFDVRRDGTVVITHHGRQATVLRGARAEAFLGEVDADPQCDGAVDRQLQARQRAAGGSTHATAERSSPDGGRRT